MDSKELEQRHRDWLGALQPEGLVVGAGVLAHKGIQLPDEVRAEQARLQEHIADPEDPRLPAASELPDLLADLFDWQDLIGTAARPIPPETTLFLAEYGETLQPDYLLEDLNGKPMLAIKREDAPLDKKEKQREGWPVPPRTRFERLIRHLEVPIGLLLGPTELRLVYAPKNESAGHISFPLEELLTVDGRPYLGALIMLLHAESLDAEPGQNTVDLMRQSRTWQNNVSAELSDQVLAALGELLRGFQQADAQRDSGLPPLLDLARTDHVYGGLLTTVMRLVFLLYAEDGGSMPGDHLYTRYYSVKGLFEQLRDDRVAHRDTMDERYGAYARLLSLFRLVFTGGGHGEMHLPERAGGLFDPEPYPFLEGRVGRAWNPGETLQHLPRIADGVIHRVLERLMYLNGERISYRTLDVEQIGSVYESMMGYEIQRARGSVLPLRLDRARVYVDLDDLLATPPGRRGKHFTDRYQYGLNASQTSALKGATNPEELQQAFGKLVPRDAERLAGILYLQPGAERRRSGSHYTPRTLTEPIVAETLRPILRDLGENPEPTELLALKICDPAMGSGAFLVAVCRHLGAVLEEAWRRHGMPSLPADEEVGLHARRLVAQNCIYGVDRNHFAVDLAKLSLWLETLARDHPFTFLDHALRHGDSLVGLDEERIRYRVTARQEGHGALFDGLETEVAEASQLRGGIAELGEDAYRAKADLTDQARHKLHRAVAAGDLLCAAHFGPRKQREERKKATLERLERILDDEVNLANELEAMREGGVVPFHWRLEFPEVYTRGGFDAMVGNPPFAGKNTIAAGNPEGYLEWLKEAFVGSHGNSDLVAYFFRQAYDQIKTGGSLGLVATNTISQGNTRETGLGHLCQQQAATLYHVTTRLPWPRAAAVVVSVVHLRKGEEQGPFQLDGASVPQITAYLASGGEHGDPTPLAETEGIAYIGSYVLGMGFTFDDSDSKGAANSLATLRQLLAEDTRNGERIFPYLGGREINSEPGHAHHRYVIGFDLMNEREVNQWPSLLALIEEKKLQKEDGKKHWWHWSRPRIELRRKQRQRQTVLVASRVSSHLAITRVSARTVFAETVVVFIGEEPLFALLQSRVHELWARFFSSSMRNDMRYTPETCFKPFPLPTNWQTSETLREAGRRYFRHRARLMIDRDEGMTKTYNRFHDPDEQAEDIVALRRLHDEMDRAVLDAYGWTDLAPQPAFRHLYSGETAEAEAEALARGEERPDPGPLRYAWSFAVRDELLGRLLELNRVRPKLPKKGKASKAARGRPQLKKTGEKQAIESKPKTAHPDQIELF